MTVEPTEPTNEDLAKLYGAAAPFSEHRRGDYIHYLSTRSGKLVVSAKSEQVLGPRVITRREE